MDTYQSNSIPADALRGQIPNYKLENSYWDLNTQDGLYVIESSNRVTLGQSKTIGFRDGSLPNSKLVTPYITINNVQVPLGGSIITANTLPDGSIPNSKLANSSITINGTPVSLGGSTTISASGSITITAGTGLTGGGSVAIGGSTTLNLGTPVATTNGGTGLSSYSAGDVLYASASNTLAVLAKNTTATRYLANTGTSNVPKWDQIDLSNGITGTLPVGNGGIGRASQTAYAVLCGGTTTTSAQQSIASVGTAKQLLASNGASALPTMQSADTSYLADFTDVTSFTPTISGGTSTGTGTYTIQVGRYSKIGKIVYVYAYVEWSAHTGTGDLLLTALPFVFRSTSNYFPSGDCYVYNMTLPAGTVGVAAQGIATVGTCDFFSIQNGAAAIKVQMDSAAGLVLNMCYITD